MPGHRGEERPDEELIHRIVRPLVLVTNAAGEDVAAPAARYISAKEKADLRRFAESVSGQWSLRHAKRHTPHCFRPEGMSAEDGYDLAELARQVHRTVTPPAFWGDMARRSVPVRYHCDRLRDRWWRKKIAANRRVDLATELKRARRSHGLLRRAFGRWLEADRPFDPEREARARAARSNPIRFDVRAEWTNLKNSMLKVVAIDHRYLWSRFGLFGLRFAEFTPYREAFFDGLAKALREKGAGSRLDNFNGERWELCMRAWTVYARALEPTWPYRKVRRLIAQIIVNYEFLKSARRKVTAKSVGAWLSRNGWPADLPHQVDTLM